MDLFNKKKVLALEKEISGLKDELKKLMSNKEEIKYLDLKTELSKLDNEIKIKKESLKALDYVIELKTKRSRELKGKLDKKEANMKKKRLKSYYINNNVYDNKNNDSPTYESSKLTVNENPSDFVGRLKRWEKNPDSEPELEQWYQNNYKKSSMYIDDINKIQSHKNTVDNNLKDSIVFTSKQDSLKFQEDQFKIIYPKYEKALEYEQNEDYNKALELYQDILKNNIPTGSSYYEKPIDLLEKKFKFEEAIEICDLAIHNIKKYNLHFDAFSFENWKDKLYSEIKILEKLLPYIKNNPGILQKDVYKEFDLQYKEIIRFLLYYMDKNNKIIRKKHSNSYELYMNNKSS